MLSFNKTIEVLIAAIKDIENNNHVSGSYGLLLVADHGNKRAIEAVIEQQPAIRELFQTVGREIITSK